MVAAKKITPTTNSSQHFSRLTRLLLDPNFKNSYSASYKNPVDKDSSSRIEAEYQMEKVFLSMY